jgi:hypothetical protein
MTLRIEVIITVGVIDGKANINDDKANQLLSSRPEGVVSHATDLIEHPELVADRLITFAEIVGQENVIAGTDCGLGGRVHRQIAWAKLRAVHLTPFRTLNFEP